MSDSRTNQPVDLAEVLLRSADPFFFVDDAGIIRAWNFGAELLLGWTRDEALGAEVSIVLPEIPPGPPSEEEPEESLHDSVVAENFQTVFKAKDGHQIPVKITVTLIRDENGVLLGSAVNARNVAREKALEQELRWRIGEMEMLDNVARAVQSTLDIQRVLRIILTAFTAGSGLGFNRAILFLVSGSLLEARLGIGSSNWEEAGRMWPRVADKPDLSPSSTSCLLRTIPPPLLFTKS
ncbi:MAG TPA: PAS domain S-box protein, partial [Candidatus Latescibacteria bacterium]|nr:PAS domain S-box protein [Candidatus Latescibacterota bacterium]